MGAMLGWQPRFINIPISSEAMYTTRPAPPVNETAGEKMRVKLMGIREKLLQGDIKGAHQLLENIHVAEIARFEYLGDLQVCVEDGHPHRKDKEESGLWETCLKHSRAMGRFHGNYGRQLDLETSISTCRFCTTNKNDPKKSCVVLHDREAFASSEGVIVVRFHCKAQSGEDNKILSKGCLNMLLTLARPVYDTVRQSRTITLRPPSSLPQMTLTSMYKQTEQGSPSVPFSFCAAVLTTASAVHKTEGDIIKIRNATEVVILIGSKTSLQHGGHSVDDCEKQLKAVAHKDYKTLRAESVAAYQELFKRVSFDIYASSDQQQVVTPSCARWTPSNKRLWWHGKPCTEGDDERMVYDYGLIQQFYQYSRYLAISASASRSEYPMNLQGLWSNSMLNAWGSDFHFNINLQMAYWGVHVANLFETATPLLTFIDRLAEEGQVTAKQYYGCHGWAAHAFTDVWLDGDLHGDFVWALCPTCGAWLGLIAWEHFLFTQDHDYLESKAQSLLKGMVDFFSCYTFTNDGGLVLTGPSTSPENSYRWTDPSIPNPPNDMAFFLTLAPTIDISIVKEVCEAYLSAVQILGLVDKEEEKVRVTNALGMLDKLPNRGQPRVSEEGRILEYMVDYPDLDPGHRHFSGLFPVFPGRTFDISGKTKEAALKTLNHKMGNGGGHVGWSRAWAINLFARLGQGDDAHSSLQFMLDKFTMSNLWTVHPHLEHFVPPGLVNNCEGCVKPTPGIYISPPDAQQNAFKNRQGGVFQIDGSMGVLSGIQEMLVQSHRAREIDLLPALPKIWGKGKVMGLRARGGLEVDICFDHHEATMATIRAKANPVTSLTVRFKRKELTPTSVSNIMVLQEAASGQPEKGNSEVKLVTDRGAPECSISTGPLQAGSKLHIVIQRSSPCASAIMPLLDRIDAQS